MQTREFSFYNELARNLSNKIVYYVSVNLIQGPSAHLMGLLTICM